MLFIGLKRKKEKLEEEIYNQKKYLAIIIDDVLRQKDSADYWKSRREELFKQYNEIQLCIYDRFEQWLKEYVDQGSVADLREGFDVKHFVKNHPDLAYEIYGKVCELQARNAK